MNRLKIATVAFILTGGAFAMSWFGSGEVSWDDYNAAMRKGRPRTATNVLEKIERQAVAERNWPSAARAVGNEYSFHQVFLTIFTPETASRRQRYLSPLVPCRRV